MSAPLVSIVVDNHNYERYLGEAIDSALGQTYGPVEVLVVDDGSTDGSRELIGSYGDRVVAIPKEQGGHTSALNLGARESSGDIVCFLDADDVLLPTTIELAVPRFEDPSVVNVTWWLDEIDATGRRTGARWPRGHEAPAGDARELLLREGPGRWPTPPTSAHAWRGSFLRRVMPLPELERSYGGGTANADSALFMLALAYGISARLDAPGGLYRVHGENASGSSSIRVLLPRWLLINDVWLDLLAEHCLKLGLDADPGRWRRQSYLHRMDRGTQAMAELVRPGERFVLIDDDQWDHHSGNSEIVGGRVALPFIERDGRFWGWPEDSRMAIAELEKVRRAGVRVLVIAWSAFWWLEFYSEFAMHLRENYKCLLDTDHMLAFELGQEGHETSAAGSAVREVTA